MSLVWVSRLRVSAIGRVAPKVLQKNNFPPTYFLMHFGADVSGFFKALGQVFLVFAALKASLEIEGF